MQGYLENYGAGEEQRERKLRLLIVSVVGVAIIASILYYSFRDSRHEKRLTGFLEALRNKDYKTAYSFWGCTVEVQCRDYTFDKFIEDWGPGGVNEKAALGKLIDTERCGTGFMGTLQAGNESVALWVERSTGVVGYAPWQECPEKKLRIRKWLRMRFGIG